MYIFRLWRCQVWLQAKGSNEIEIVWSKDVVFYEQEFFTNLGILEKPSDTDIVPDITSFSPLVENVTNRKELYKEFEIDNEPTVGNIDNVNIKGVE